MREYGACIAAERLGLPHAVVAINAIGEFVPAGQVAPMLNALRAAHDLPPDPEMAMLYRYLRLCPFPPGLQDPALPVPPTTHYLRPMLGDRSGPEGLPPWVAALPDRPVVYLGLGTALPTRPPEVFRAVIAGLRDEALTLIVTVGRDQDPADYGPQPANVHIERYIPLSLLLSRCDLVVNNGGSGTLVAALSHGLPVVLVPITADQPENAARCAALGLGRVIAPSGADTGAGTGCRAGCAGRPVVPAQRGAAARRDRDAAGAGVRGGAARAARGRKAAVARRLTSGVTTLRGWLMQAEAGTERRGYDLVRRHPPRRSCLRADASTITRRRDPYGGIDSPSR